MPSMSKAMTAVLHGAVCGAAAAVLLGLVMLLVALGTGAYQPTQSIRRFAEEGLRLGMTKAPTDRRGLFVTPKDAASTRA